jgi:hypothetical protein
MGEVKVRLVRATAPADSDLTARFYIVGSHGTTSKVAQIIEVGRWENRARNEFQRIVERATTEHMLKQWGKS